MAPSPTYAALLLRKLQIDTSALSPTALSPAHSPYTPPNLVA